MRGASTIPPAGHAVNSFLSTCKLYVDSSANAYLDMEFLGHLVEKFVEEVAGG